MRRGYVNTSLGEIHYREQQGPHPVRLGRTDLSLRGEATLVLLHHSTRSSDVWREAIPCFAETFRVVALDTPGFGQSSKPAEAPGLVGYTRAFAEALDGLAIERCHLFGFLTGAALAIEFAARYPDRVDRLVLGSCPVIDDRVRWSQNAPLNHEQADGSHLLRIWNGYATGAYAGWGSLDQVQRAALDSAIAGAEQAHFAHLAVAELDVQARIPAITAPTLLIGGSRGPFADRQAEIQPLFRHAERIELAGGPLIMQEQPAELCQVVTEFLAR